MDEEGNEIPIAELRARDEKPAKAEPKSKGQAKRPQRGALREVPPPSWERAFRRGGMMGAAMVLIFLLFLKNGPLAERLLIGVFYAVMFVPLTYVVDRTAYRSYQKRLARQNAPKAKPAAKKP